MSEKIYFKLDFLLTNFPVNYRMFKIKPLKKSREALRRIRLKWQILPHFRVTLLSGKVFSMIVIIFIVSKKQGEELHA